MEPLSKNQLNQFLKSMKRKSNEVYTHTGLPCPPDSFGGSYTIPYNKYQEFLKIYHKSVFENGNNAYLTEKHLDYGPIVIDLDFRFPLKIKKRKYDEKFIKEFINIYMSHIEKITSCSDIEIFVMEKKTPKPNTEKKVVKDGIHFMIPDIITIPKYQYCLRHDVINDPRTVELMKTIEPINDLNDIIDLCVIERNNWQMYGSMKPNNEPYLVSHIYNYNENSDLEELDIKSNYTSFELLERLSLRNVKESDISEINEDSYETLDKLYESMPDEFKARRKRTKKPKKSRKTKNKIKNIQGTEDFSPEREKKELDKIGKLVDILDPKRAEDYTMWIQLGWCLHNIDFRLLSVWVAFSKKSPKYNEGECENEWEVMDCNGLGMGTLYMWCKQDNFEKYKELTVNDLNILIYKSLNGSHNDIARVMYEMFKDEFIYGRSKNWYQFKNHKWNMIDDGIPLKKRISNQLLNQYLKYSNYLSNKIQDMSDDDPAKDIEHSKYEKTQKVVGKLKTNSFKNALMNECIEMFYNDEFEQKLDSNVNLLCFDNGVYDLENDHFREGIPDDFISFSTNINYEEFDADDENIRDINKFIAQIQPKKSVREYVLTLLSTFLDGKITEEKFPIWTGTGGNGKSKLIELMSKAMGDYRCPLPISLLTQKRARSEACNPALAEAPGKRFAPFQEPDSGDRINVGLMKELSGGDEIKVRNLYRGNITYKPQFKMMLACNYMPEVDPDDGVFRRLRVVAFKSKFRHNPDPNDPYQFPIDTSLSLKFESWAEPFMFILLQYYKKYKLEGLYEPDEVKLATENYKNDSDCFASFFSEKIEEVEGSLIHIDIAYAKFKDWYSQSFGSTKIPIRKELKKHMIKKYGKGDKSGNNFKGIDWINEFNGGFLEDVIEDI